MQVAEMGINAINVARSVQGAKTNSTVSPRVYAERIAEIALGSAMIPSFGREWRKPFFSDSPLEIQSSPFLALFQPPTFASVPSPTLAIRGLAPKPLGMEINRRLYSWLGNIPSRVLYMHVSS